MDKLTQAQSKVEVSGFEARHYDTLMDLVTLGRYPSFINQVIQDLSLKKGDHILDFGAGTGRNALIMYKYIGETGKIVALEIGKEMQRQFRKKTASFKNIKLVAQRIEKPLPYKNSFDVVFTAFVLHGFVQEKRDAIIKNAYNALKDNGFFAILDYNNFDVDKAPCYVRFAIRHVECPLAEEFIRKKTESMLAGAGFSDFNTRYYFKGYIRLLKAFKCL